MTTCYISCACNAGPHSVDWGKNNLICYAACNAIAIYDPDASKTGEVLFTLSKHTERVSIVQWIRTNNNEAESELLSGSSDKSTIIWTKFDNTYEPTSVLHDTNAVTIVTSQYTEDICSEKTTSRRDLRICTGNIDGQIRIWERHGCEDTKCVQVMEFGPKIPITARLWFWPGTKIPLIALAMDDSTIQLFSHHVDQTTMANFVHVQNLIGHEDWVCCLDFANDDNKDILLASGSQDSMIRLWKISKDTDEILNADLRQKKDQFLIDSNAYNVTLESILISHEGWVYGVHWHPTVLRDGKYHQPMKLLSCSLDKTMILWEPNLDSGVWLESVRVGEVGGNSSGFYGCKFGPDGDLLLAHDYQGSFHIWQRVAKRENWISRPAPGGHYSEVVDLCWDQQGRFLLTASLDETTRIHTPWHRESGKAWHEIGRPQIHGYGISCLAMLTPYMFASGAEEKVIRLFTAPVTFINYLKHLFNVDDCTGMIPESASVPALGLTNKALFDEAVPSGESLYVPNSKKLNFEEPPTEEELIQHTLWPELQKLYGHGYEIFSIAAKSDGSLLASACKSSSLEHSAIILWDTQNWKLLQKLSSHQLTVTQLAFSPNGKYLLSVSRDRRWSLFVQGENEYHLWAASAKKDALHSRIIWCCAWSPDSQYFATGSRDGKIGIWSPASFEPNKYLPMTSLEFKDASITAIAFAQLPEQNFYIVAIGFDKGYIDIYKLIINGDHQVWKPYKSLDMSAAHHLTVKRLSFRPRNTHSNCNIVQLASCGSDHTVKIHDFESQDLVNV